MGYNLDKVLLTKQSSIDSVYNGRHPILRNLVPRTHFASFSHILWVRGWRLNLIIKSVQKPANVQSQFMQSFVKKYVKPLVKKFTKLFTKPFREANLQSQFVVKFVKLFIEQICKAIIKETDEAICKNISKVNLCSN